jgi:hypothetical protein
LLDAGLARLVELLNLNFDFLNNSILAGSLRERKLNALQVRIVAYVLCHRGRATNHSPFPKFDDVEVSLGRRFEHTILRVAHLNVLLFRLGDRRRTGRGRPGTWLTFLTTGLAKRQANRENSEQAIGARYHRLLYVRLSSLTCSGFCQAGKPDVLIKSLKQ